MKTQNKIRKNKNQKIFLRLQFNLKLAHNFTIN